MTSVNSPIRTAAAWLTVGISLAVASDALAQGWYFEGQALYFKREDNRRQFDYFSSAVDRLDPSQDLPFSNDWGHRFIVSYDDLVHEIEGSFSRFDDWRTGVPTTLLRTAGGELSLDLDPAGQGVPLNIFTSLQQAAVQEEEPDGLGTTRINTAERLLNTSYQVTYISDWQDADVNIKIRLPSSPWIKMGLGARYGELREFFNLGILGTFDDSPLGDNLSKELRHDSLTNPGINGGNINNTVVGGGMTLISGGATGFQGDVVGGLAATPSILDIDHDTNLVNTLLGGQVVLEATVFESDYFIVETLFKGGAYYNRIRSTLTETVRETNLDQSTYQRRFNDVKDTVAFLGNANAMIGYKLRENIRLKVGYEVQLMAGVALAADQWQHVRADNFGRATYEIDASEIVMLHGGLASLEVIW